MSEEILSNQEVDSLVREVSAIAKKDSLSISRAFVFGSYAKNKANKKSDLDLCFISPQFKDSIKAEAYLRTKIYFSFKRNIPVDVVAYSPEEFRDSAPLAYEIKRSGREIKI